MKEADARLSPLPETTAAVDMDKVNYYYGNISRETAEWILCERGCKDGLYLLRKSKDDYVLSLCFEKSVLHYRISCLSDGGFALAGTQDQVFGDPLQLVENVEGLATKPLHPCQRCVEAILPPTYWGLSEEQVKKFILLRSRQWGLDENRLENLTQQDAADLRVLISKTLHEIQPWFHGPLSRLEAEARIEEAGHADGRFLIRERDDSSYALCLSHAFSVKHYKVDVLSTGDFAIENGYHFPSLMSLVSHYTLFADGLWCPLIEAIVRPDSLDENTFLKNISKATRHFFNKSPKSKLFGTIPNKGILNKIVSSISTQATNTSYRSAKTLPRLSQMRNTESACCGDENCYPGTLEGNCKASTKLQKSSSIDHVLPGFIQYFMSLDGTVRRGRKCQESKLLDELACEQARSMEQHYNHYGMTVPLSADGSPRVLTENCCSGPMSAPVPAPRTSLARRDILTEEDPVYVNREPDGTETAYDCSPRRLSLDMNLEDRRNQQFSGLLAYRKPMKIPIDLSPSPPLIDLSEANYEEIDSLIEKCPRLIRDKLKKEALDENVDIPQVDEIPRDRLERTIAEAIKETSNQIIQEIKAEIRAVEDSSDSLDRRDSPSLDDFDPLCADNLSGPPSPERQRNFAQALADVLTQEQSEMAYNEVKKCLNGLVKIQRDNIQLIEMFGCGNFGQVHKATLKHEGNEIPCATKSLRAEFSQASMGALSQEADLLASLDHPHVVRLFGVSEIDTGLMMVMELAPLGPLNRFLRYNRETNVGVILNLMLQVALAMEYLEHRNFVHRDLAARNVLLVNTQFAKISDFGMSRTLGIGRDYYKAEAAGKWPLKWYAPECIYYFKFSTKSDVWSYGVTLWEAMSYGDRPYKNLAGQDILVMFESNKRLEMPDECPPEVYDIMWKCWAYMPEDRPDFSEVCQLMRAAIDANEGKTPTNSEEGHQMDFPPPPSDLQLEPPGVGVGTLPPVEEDELEDCID